MRVAFETLGCKVNTYETEAVWKMFEESGFSRVDFKNEADVYVINTCTVTNTGDSKSRKVIRQAIRRNPDAVIVVMGCYAQLKPKEIQDIEGVDVIVGTQGRDKLLDYVKEYLNERKPITDVSDIMKTKKFETMQVEDFTENTRAFLKIQEGCNNFCTYCIIPWARGLMRSRDREDVLNQVQTFVDNGYKEVVLTGIHTAGYGEDLEGYDFTMLLEDIIKNEGLKRLRISSIEASQITDGIIEMLKHDKIARHLHVPVQSGSEKVLKDMKRKYSKAEFIETIKKLKKEVPGISITTDVIVGFPTETKEDFREMYDYIKEVGFAELHIFPYSKRNGTPAAKMKNVVTDIEKTMRVNELLTLNEELALNYAKNFQNEVVEVIIETIKDGKAVGHTSNYLKVEFDPKGNKVGEMVEVVIEKIGYPINFGQIK